MLWSRLVLLLDITIKNLFKKNLFSFAVICTNFFRENFDTKVLNDILFKPNGETGLHVVLKLLTQETRE